jgi:hypothetical protein
MLGRRRRRDRANPAQARRHFFAHRRLVSEMTGCTPFGIGRQTWHRHSFSLAATSAHHRRPRLHLEQLALDGGGLAEIGGCVGTIEGLDTAAAIPSPGAGSVGMAGGGGGGGVGAE